MKSDKCSKFRKRSLWSFHWFVQELTCDHALLPCILCQKKPAWSKVIQEQSVSTDDERSPLLRCWRHRPRLKFCTLQVLQRETIFPVTPKSEWLGRLSLKYTRKCLETWMKNSKQNSPYISYIWLFHDKNSPSWWCFLRNSRTGSKPSRRLTTQHNDKLKRKNLTLKILVPIPE